MEKDTVRIGKVSGVDYAKGLIQVAYHDRDDSVTAPMPMLSDKYIMPEVGDQVIVLHLSNGSEAGLVLGRYYTEKNPPKESGKGVFFLPLNHDGTDYIKYQGGTVTIKSSAAQFTGSLSVSGNLAVAGSINAASVSASGDVTAGGVSLKSHTHTGVHGETSGPH